jgi:uncharacterized protein (DUF2225 family)
MSDKVYDLCIISYENINLRRVKNILYEDNIALLLIADSLVDLQKYTTDKDYNWNYLISQITADIFSNVLLTEINTIEEIYNIAFEYNGDTNIKTFKNNVLAKRIVVV